MTHHWKDGSLDLSFGKMHYTRTGDGPVLILAHGFSDNGLCWTRVAEELDARYDVIMPDSRGHGLSERVIPGQEIFHAADLAELIQALKLVNPILIGHSMGADTITHLAVRFPSLARVLILEDPPWRDPDPQQDPARTQRSNWLEALFAKNEEELLAQCRLEQPGWHEKEARPWARSKTQLDRNIRLAAAPPRPAWRETVRAIQCATLLITADADKGAIVSQEHAAEAAQLNHLLEVAHIPGAGHSIRRDQFEAYMRAVKDFLARQD